MSNIAKSRKTGEVVDASGVTDLKWNELKDKSRKGDFQMICCGADAVLKTSLNAVHFFAHYSGECSTAPEQVWHLEAKSLISSYLSNIGVLCTEEYTGVSKNQKKWVADTYFEYMGRNIVVEIQNSYQTLAKYRERQQIYVDSGVECYWLLYQPRFRTLVKSLGRYRLEHEFGGKFPPQGFFQPFIESLPCMWLELGSDPKVRGVSKTCYQLDQWILSILEGKFQYYDGRWFIQQL